jgi:hypothetical protein
LWFIKAAFAPPTVPSVHPVLVAVARKCPVPANEGRGAVSHYYLVYGKEPDKTGPPPQQVLLYKFSEYGFECVEDAREFLEMVVRELKARGVTEIELKECDQ